MIQAFQWWGEEVDGFERVGVGADELSNPHYNLIIPTLEGTMYAAEGDWIITGVKGEFYPCKPDIFEATYEAFQVAFSEPTDDDMQWAAEQAGSLK